MKFRVIVHIWRFYMEGFASMTLGRTLWMIIIIKLIIMFGILKIVFFPRHLQGTHEEKSQAVSTQLTDRAH